MTPGEFRANAAGYLDSASTLLRTVTETLKTGETMKAPNGQRLVECPPAIHEVLAEADERLQRVAGWLLSPIDVKFE